METVQSLNELETWWNAGDPEVKSKLVDMACLPRIAANSPWSLLSRNEREKLLQAAQRIVQI